MARLVGTGKAPDDQYLEGQVFDVESFDPLYEDLLDRGWAEEVDPEDDPGRTETQIANAVVRGDPVAHPVERKIAEGIKDPYAVVHRQDPKATDKELEKATKAGRESAIANDPDKIESVRKGG